MLGAGVVAYAPPVEGPAPKGVLVGTWVGARAENTAVGLPPNVPSPSFSGEASIARAPQPLRARAGTGIATNVRVRLAVR